ncbi:venom protein 164 [Biomphalaria pfeifferi]|uniref:Venom protein 164 n=1 Tax=Biomphalaria pfeifferi TaxID=112525 RepID=A0AAD8C9Z8_BIOPF|nr:venom protein 164 [Biomphalaria pfeifferi]
MRLAYVVFCIASTLLHFSEAQKSQDKPCVTSADCGAAECCLSPAVFRGRRQTGGYCMPRGSNGNHCYVRNDQFVNHHFNTLYYNACPCVSEQHCKGTGMIEVPQGETGLCQADHKREASGACQSTKDCAADECCVSNIQPIGKKKRAAISFGGGTCQKLGKSGESCMVRVTAVTDMNLSCPCTTGLTCKGTGMFVVPLGETGVCE